MSTGYRCIAIRSRPLNAGHRRRGPARSERGHGPEPAGIVSRSTEIEVPECGDGQVRRPIWDASPSSRMELLRFSGGRQQTQMVRPAVGPRGGERSEPRSWGAGGRTVCGQRAERALNEYRNYSPHDGSQTTATATVVRSHRTTWGVAEAILRGRAIPRRRAINGITTCPEIHLT